MMKLKKTFLISIRKYYLKDLRDLETNGIVKRIVKNTISVTVEYELTKSGEEFRNVFDAMIECSLDHRKATLDSITSNSLENSLK